MIKENTKEWKKAGKVRNYFFGSKRLNKSGAYYTEDKSDTSDGILAETDHGFIVSKKSYNGAIIEEIIEICELVVVETNFAGRPEKVSEINTEEEIGSMDTEIIEAAKNEIIKSEQDTDPTVWGLDTADQIIDNLNSHYAPVTPDYKHWVDDELDEVNFSFNDVGYTAYREIDGDGWHVISDQDLRKVRNHVA